MLIRSQIYYVLREKKDNGRLYGCISTNSLVVVRNSDVDKTLTFQEANHKLHLSFYIALQHQV